MLERGSPFKLSMFDVDANSYSNCIVVPNAMPDWTVDEGALFARS